MNHFLHVGFLRVLQNSRP